MRNKSSLPNKVDTISRYFSTLNSQLSLQKGYTFIELLVVFSIIAIISGASIAAFVNFGNTQAVDTTAEEIASVVTSARQQAVSQIKPSQCTATQSLSRYSVVIDKAASTYNVEANCGGQNVQVTTRRLPSQMTFTQDTPSRVEFILPNASVSQPASIKVTGFGKTKSVNIDRTGAIAVQ